MFAYYSYYEDIEDKELYLTVITQVQSHCMTKVIVPRKRYSHENIREA